MNWHIPSGRLLEHDQLRAIAEVIGDSDAHLLVDEVYAPVILSEDVRADGAIGGPTAAGLPSTIVSQSLTEFYGLGGIRTGWLIARPDVLDHVRPMMSHLPVNGHPSTHLTGRIP